MKWWQPSQSENIQPIPWLHPDAIKYLDGILNPDMQVVEFGGGGSTLWLAERVKAVITCEPNEQWFNKLFEIVPDNVSVFNRLDFVMVPCDLIFIDGEPVTVRSDWLRAAAYTLKSGGWIVLDNANRPEYAKERNDLYLVAELVHTANGNEGGTKYLVTEFWRIK